MAVLHNRISHRELKQRILSETEPRTTISFYRYFRINDPQQFRDDLYKAFYTLSVYGRVYIASEGINAQISVPQSQFEKFKNVLDAIPGLRHTRLNIAIEDDGKSFWVLKIKIREKIVADGINDSSFDMTKKGKYVNAKELNYLTDDPNTIIIDMRNHYEYEVGHFKNAIEIPSDTFREQLPMALEMMQPYKNNNIIMYCTGGIRCEKASAYLLHNGFKNVYHLEGGVIHYARQIQEQQLESRFIGKNFVFDDRLGERITNDIIAHCHQCGKPCDTHTNCMNDGCHLLFIQCTECAQKYHGCCSVECREIHQLSPEQQKELRKGNDKGQHIFNKAKSRLLSIVAEEE